MRGKIDYNKSNLSKVEQSLIMLRAFAVTAVVGYLFYHSIYAVVLMIPLFILVVRRQKKTHIKMRKMQLLYQFKEGITIVLSGLEAGYSIENAFEDACRELHQVYRKQTDIEVEFRHICKGIKLNEQLEVLLMDFAGRSGLEDVRNFADVFMISKHRGGDMITIIRSSIHIIQEKIDVNQEIDTMLAGKRLEQNIMNIVPLGILFYVNLTSPDFLSSLYGNLIGAFIMSGCLIVYAGAYMLGKRIIEVEI